jgi:hypothetical protein
VGAPQTVSVWSKRRRGVLSGPFFTAAAFSLALQSGSPQFSVYLFHTTEKKPEGITGGPVMGKNMGPTPLRLSLRTATLSWAPRTRLREGDAAFLSLNTLSRALWGVPHSFPHVASATPDPISLFGSLFAGMLAGIAAIGGGNLRLGPSRWSFAAPSPDAVLEQPRPRRKTPRDLRSKSRLSAGPRKRCHSPLRL